MIKLPVLLTLLEIFLGINTLSAARLSCIGILSIQYESGIFFTFQLIQDLDVHEVHE